MNYTTNYKLNKPERNEQYNLDDWNNNSDTIDSQMHTNAVDIATNAKDIATILAGINSRNTADTGSVFYKLMELIYPVGSLYWSSKSTNPNELFGGSWVQIKDRFVLACGNTYTATGQTGGASSVTLNVNNMPAHYHSFTPTGSVSSSFSGSVSTTNGMNRNSTGAFQNNIRGVNTVATLNSKNISNSVVDNNGAFTQGCFSIGSRIDGHSIPLYTPDHVNANNNPGSLRIDISHEHTFVAKGTVSSSFSGWTENTSTSGSGTSFSILPPFVVKYCWERTA